MNENLLEKIDRLIVTACNEKQAHIEAGNNSLADYYDGYLGALYSVKSGTGSIDRIIIRLLSYAGIEDLTVIKAKIDILLDEKINKLLSVIK